jgi:hypothetical protein
MANGKTTVGGLRWAKPGTRASMMCGICGRRCIRIANVFGPTNQGMAMFGVKALHDLFECPNDGQEWHNQVAALRYESAETHSPSVRALIDRDIDELLAANPSAREVKRRSRERLRRASAGSDATRRRP